MSHFKIDAKAIQVPNHTLMLDAYLAQPQEAGGFPAVIVFQEIFGVNAHIRDVTERLAQAEYLPSLLHSISALRLDLRQDTVLRQSRRVEHTKPKPPQMSFSAMFRLRSHT